MGFTTNVQISINKGKRKQSLKVWKMFIDCFNAMPVAALIEDKILCMHGGISP